MRVSLETSDEFPQLPSQAGKIQSQQKSLTQIGNLTEFLETFKILNTLQRDEVAERSKASVATHTVAGLNLGHGWHLFSDKSRCLERETAIPPPRAWQKPTGAQ
ncbi:hypothetical protein FWK35_00025835 [Aphis craccivora]|uniref:Uncharacterized protein n=1 Tax=Aphis craccivora TaxID=307492 RepID=A0A6G0ZH61_APHCR|nr:hypothetical protein FWK35_00025835 [Aphis craccivora]